MSITSTQRRSGVLRTFSIAAVLLASLCTGLSHAQKRTLDTAKGPVKIESTPQRVVTLDEGALDLVLALGIQPVGTVATRGAEGVSEYLKDKAGAVTIVGSTREPNLEAILRTKPDLILASEFISDQTYALLSRVAPTVIPRTSSMSDWRERAREYASAMDKAEQADQLIARFDERAASLEQRLPEALSVSLLRWNPQGPILMSNKVFAGQILRQLGLETPELAGQLGNKPHSDTLSLENLSRADADWLLVATLNPQGEETLQQASRQPAFTRLEAVKNGQMATVDGQLWSSGSGVIAAERLLDDVERILLTQ
ncbi:iron-siderophore ABC transporter substrate-binding protein [Stutzerimonas nosocomialis]|uniref:ABC transporter substrate-binding protein n=1 Tax=Stutzerimonas nosocomialis TaxID=1056496 RepID=UPI001109A6D1|nr:iron-siderophore ABC transporter substrate-binding protein [Stutzerimonas nosocomialis]TLX53433.1 iron-siderophore ABC transporter substrate-binding protein [Stutzerimonas nosocomialis]